MAEQKPGFFKRIFSFALGKRSAPAEETPKPALAPAEEAPPATSKPDATPEPAALEQRPTEPEAIEQRPAREPEPAAEVAERAVRAKPKPAAKAKAQKEKAPPPEPPAEPKPAASKRAKPKPKPEVAAGRARAPAAPKKTPAEVARDVAPVEAPGPAARFEPVQAPSTAKAPPIAPEPVATVPERPVAQAPTGKLRVLESRAKSAVTEPVAEKAGWLARLRKGLSRSSQALTGNIAAVLSKRRLDDETLQELEDVLIQADLGVETAMRITEALSAQRYGRDVTEEEVREIMAAELAKVLEPVAIPLELDLDRRPHVILVVGVNGTGKTTTIGKLAAKLREAGLSTLLVAGDTFRAAAIEQLKIWGERTGSPVAARQIGADAAGLAYDAFQQAVDEGHDVVLMDTAGRLQNKTELMAELEKIIRVLKKRDPSAPHTVLLTLDATTGQNALSQVEIFRNVAGVNGLVMTKLDGTARGGILVAIAARHKLPVFFVGVGEQVGDLEPFEADEFARSIAGLERAGEQAA